MTQSTTKSIVDNFKSNIGAGDSIGVKGRWIWEITRADGITEVITADNIVTKDGLNTIAALMLGDATGVNSAFKYLAIGTSTSAGSLGSVQSGLGEVGRKIGSIITSSNEVAIISATWAGNTDGLTGVALGSAGVVNHAGSGSGIFGNHVNSVSATLNASDFLKVQMEIQIGSHAL